MAQITEDYVSFETAKLMKEKGFDVFGDGSYGTETEVHREYSPFGKIRDISASRPSQKGYPASTLQMAMKWLLQTHNIFIEIRITNHSMSKMINVIRYYWILSCSETGKWVDESTLHTVGAFISPEQACEAAIKYCLENLI